jgi:DNA-binding response OmpR family regulator
VNDIEIDLKNKEYELLLFLALNEIVVFNRETLYEVFGAWTPWEITPQSAVHINRLRIRSKEIRNPQYIQTVRRWQVIGSRCK